jgi:RHS repeat-associated protein
VDASGYATRFAPVSAPPPAVSQLDWDTNGSLSLILSNAVYDYVYGPSSTPVEQINLASSAPIFLSYVSSDSTWFTTNVTGDETGFYGFDAYGNLAFGTPTSPFGFSGEYTDATTGFLNMRARFYDTNSGEFLARDPAFLLTDNAYAYADDDPVNSSDPTGLYDYYTSEDIGPVSGGDDHVGTAEQVMDGFRSYFKLVFPFPISGCNAIVDGAQCELHALDLYGTPLVYLPCGTPLVAGCGGVRVQSVTQTSFQFKVDQSGYFDAPGATITFWTSETNCEVFLHQHGYAPETNGLDGRLHQFVALSLAWPSQGANLKALMYELNGEAPDAGGPHGPPEPGFPTTPPTGAP